VYVCAHVRECVRACVHVCEGVGHLCVLCTSFQNSEAPPPNQCSAAVQNLYGPGDLCTNNVRSALAGMTTFDSIFDPDTSMPGCPRRLTGFLNYCSFISNVSNGSFVSYIHLLF